MWEYVHDFENKLTSVKVDGVVTEQYVYDGDGNRIKKTDSSSERIYLYSGMNVSYEVNTTTQMHAVYVYGPTGKIAKKVNDITEYYHTDHLGSTRLVTTEDGAVTEEIQYQPFGEEIGTSEERYTYNGKERDETGLYYYGARYYDPAIGRFMKIDNNLGDWGQTNNPDKIISINFSSGKVGDIALTVLHEVCHAMLGDPKDKEDRQQSEHSPRHFLDCLDGWKSSLSLPGHPLHLFSPSIFLSHVHQNPATPRRSFSVGL